MKKRTVSFILYIMLFAVFGYLRFSGIATENGMPVEQTISSSFYNVFISNRNWVILLNGIVMTLFCLLSSLILGIILGFALFLLAYSKKPIAMFIIDFFDNIFFYLPFSTWILAIFYIFFNSNEKANTTVAILALTISLGFHSYEQLMRSVNNIGISELEAAVSMGYSRYLAFFKILLPHACDTFFVQLNDVLVAHVQATSLVGLVSVIDIQMAADNIAVNTGESFLPIILTSFVYILLGIGMSTIVEKLQSYLIHQKTEEAIRTRIEKGRF